MSDNSKITDEKLKDANGGLFLQHNQTLRKNYCWLHGNEKEYSLPLQDAKLEAQRVNLSEIDNGVYLSQTEDGTFIGNIVQDGVKYVANGHEMHDSNKNCVGIKWIK